MRPLEAPHRGWPAMNRTAQPLVLFPRGPGGPAEPHRPKAAGDAAREKVKTRHMEVVPNVWNNPMYGMYNPLYKQFKNQ